MEKTNNDSRIYELWLKLKGQNPSTFLFFPMLDVSIEFFPEYLDCFVGDEERPDTFGKIIVFTRTGGHLMRDYLIPHQRIWLHPQYDLGYDDPYCPVYHNWVFTIPDKWKKDFELIHDKDQLENVSQEYVNQVKKIFPEFLDSIDSWFYRED